jgi:ABC-type bacteriocin/lantibiotic exporter with double-glycine peptidase domain
MLLSHYKFTFQRGTGDCGLAALDIIFKILEVTFDYDSIYRLYKYEVEISLNQLKQISIENGITPLIGKYNFENLEEIIDLHNIIIHWEMNHFVVIPACYRIGGILIYEVLDPRGKIMHFKLEEIRPFCSNADGYIFALLFNKSEVKPNCRK